MKHVVAIMLAVCARLAAAQTPDSSHAASAVVAGVVYDSVSHAPLVGATVQLVANDRSSHFGGAAISDSLGRFSVAGVPDGQYLIGFFHPMLDSLGLEPTVRGLAVRNGESVRTELAIPSAARLRSAFCGKDATSDLSAAIVGVVRDARNGEPMINASVTGEWLEISIGRGGTQRNIARVNATTLPNGWFVLCHLPSPSSMWLRASRGADSTDAIVVEMPAAGFLRHEMTLGAARTLMASDSAHASVGSAARQIRQGDGRLTGVVVTAEGARPIAGAIVGIVDGPRARANDKGEWSLANAPLGTRTLEARALGYYPVRKAVDVTVDGVPLRVSLSTLSAVLDTVRITASRLRDQNIADFTTRVRTGAGRYLLPSDIAARPHLRTSDLFRAQAGVRLENDSLMVRGNTASWCAADIFVDGHQLHGLDAGDLDAAVRPEDIAGIEIYSGPGAPAQFQSRLEGISVCGSIVIWTK